MPKLQKGIEYQNAHLPVAHVNYLINNGFTCLRLSSDTLQFTKDNVCIRIKNDTLNLFRHISEAEQKSWQFLQSHIGISQLDYFGWIMLLSIMKAQKANHRTPLQLV